MQRFNPEPISCHRWGGASSGLLDPGHQAEQLGLRMSGPWLTAYMIRRFGPPNAGSDDHKNLCSWSITTPMKGLALLVTPYLADDGVASCYKEMNLHLGYRHSSSLAAALHRVERKQRGFDKHLERLWRWTRKQKLCGMPIHTVGARKVLWKMGPEWLKKADGTLIPETALIAITQPLPVDETFKHYITRTELKNWWWLRDAINKLYRQRYPLRKEKPDQDWRQKRWPVSRLAYRCNLALRTTIRSLNAPIQVRDISFDIKGLIDEGADPRLKYDEENGFGGFAKRFEKAGYPCRVI